MNVMIISCFGYYEQRVRFVKEAFEQKGHHVEVVFSDFDHINKAKIVDKRAGTTYLKSRPYYKNISLSRIFSHFLFARSAYHYACKKQPDLIYAVIPPNTLGKYLKKYKKKNKVRLIFDIYDLWPESFVNQKFAGIARPFFLKWASFRNQSLNAADFVITECDLYREILAEFLDPEHTKTIYLTKGSEFEQPMISKPMETLHICYLGSINNIISIDMIVRFLKTLQNYRPIVVDIIGKGETKDDFIRKLKAQGIETIYHGALFGEDKWKIMNQCHFGINMMINTVRVGLTMKSVDYFEAGLPILNNIKGDTWTYVDNFNLGFNVDEKNIEDVARKLAKLDERQFEEMQRNVRDVFASKFSLTAFQRDFQSVLDYCEKLTHKNILILCNHEIVLYNFKKELIQKISEKGYQVHISMPFNHSLPFFEDTLKCDCIETRIDRRGINPLKDFKLILFYRKLIKELKPDLVFTLTIKPTIYGGVVSRIYGVDYITNITGLGSAFQNDNWLRKFVVHMYRVALKNVKKAFFENEDNCRVFLEDKIVEVENSCIVHGAGVNLQEFKFVNPCKNPKLVFAFIGRVMKEKGIDEFLYCVDKLRNENAEFRVYGFCEEEYIARLKEMEKNPNFHYFGFCNDIANKYNEFDIIVLPSYHEGMSNVLLEGASKGKILITSDIFGCKEAVIDGKSGFLATKADKESLLEACRKALALSYEERVAFGLEARKLMEKEFDRNIINKQYMEAIDEILGEKTL